MPVVSRMTTKEILKQGVRVGVDEACLPVKVYLGHCLNLMSECDLLLVPRIVNLRKKEFICPKFMGLPEMVKAAVTNEYGPEGKERVLVWKSEHRSFWDAPPALPDYLRKLAGPGKIKTGLHRAKQVFREYRAHTKDIFRTSRGDTGRKKCTPAGTGSSWPRSDRASLLPIRSFFKYVLINFTAEEGV